YTSLVFHEIAASNLQLDQLFGKQICNQCSNKFATPYKLCDHLKRKFEYKPKPIQILVQPFTMQVKDQVVVQEDEPEASSGPTTQVYREEIALQNEVQEVIKDSDIEMKQSDI
ncbi:18883_t:CDS:2, partial [Gigaspora margarita]